MIDIEMYKSLDDVNVINKKFELVGVDKIRLRRGVDIVNPNVKLRINMVNFNYVKMLGRWYLVESYQSINSNMWEVFLTCDVLETYKDQILNSRCNFYRGIEKGDFNQVEFDSRVDLESIFYKSKTKLEPHERIILTIVKG